MAGLKGGQTRNGRALRGHVFGSDAVRRDEARWTIIDRNAPSSPTPTRPAGRARRLVGDRTAVVHVGVEGGGARDRGAGRRHVLRRRARARAGGRLGALGRAHRRPAQRARARGRHRELGAVHPWWTHRPRGARVRPPRDAADGRGDARRAPRARRARLRARRPSRRGLRRRRHRRLACHGAPHLRRSRGCARHRASRRAVAARPHGARSAVARGRARRVGRGRRARRGRRVGRGDGRPPRRPARRARGGSRRASLDPARGSRTWR